jgi:hypothetical protein
MIAESISGRFTSLLSALTSFLVTSIFVSGCDLHTNFPTGSLPGLASTPTRRHAETPKR